MEYLKPKQHYSDRYDRHTVEKCRWWEHHLPNLEELREKAKEKGEEIDEKELIRATNAYTNLHFFFLTGDRYINKEKTIREWMQRDEESDRFFESVREPENINCLTCGRLMFVSSKHNQQGFQDEKDKVLFFFDCPLEHMPRRAFYDNGEEFRREKPTCPKCHTEVVEEDKSTDDKWVTITTCPNCDYTETSEIERTIEKEDPHFERDRARFCLDEKRGQEFIKGKENIEGLARFMDEIKEKEKNKDKYDAVAKLNKLKILELEELLVPIVEKVEYTRFQLKNPEIGKDVIVPFTVYEKKADRGEYDSKKTLERLIKTALADTNWRLMSDGVSYRLGMLEGRLRAYEREEDLLKLVEKKQDV